MAGTNSRRQGLSRAQLEPLVAEGLTIERIARQLGVSDSTAKKWLKRHGLQTSNAARRKTLDDLRASGERETDAICKRHGLTRHVSIASERRLRCSKCSVEAVERRRRKVKEILISEAGGACAICGYSRHPAALQFHHLDPASKSFGLGVRGITRSLAKLRAEAAKCVLLCANCHAEVEVGATELPVESRGSVPVHVSESD